MHLKMLSADVICCNYWRIKYRSKQHGPRTDCSYRSSLIWVYTVCHRGFRREKQTTFVVIGALRINPLHAGKFFMNCCRLLILFKNSFLKNSFRNTIRVSVCISIGLYVLQLSRLHLGPNCKWYQPPAKAVTSRCRNPLLSDLGGMVHCSKYDYFCSRR